MRLEIARQCGPNSTSGRLFVNGVFECFTLERPFNSGSNRHNLDAILPGTYKVSLAYSNHFGRDMPFLVGVPGRDAIEIHWGSYPKDTNGCILVGKAQAPDMVTGSRDAFDALWPKLLKAWSTDKDITITIN